jgi:hypothetical protein
VRFDGDALGKHVEGGVADAKLFEAVVAKQVDVGALSEPVFNKCVPRPQRAQRSLTD